MIFELKLYIFDSAYSMKRAENRKLNSKSPILKTDEWQPQLDKSEANRTINRANAMSENGKGVSGNVKEAVLAFRDEDANIHQRRSIRSYRVSCNNIAALVLRIGPFLTSWTTDPRKIQLGGVAGIHTSYSYDTRYSVTYLKI